ncbi:Gfo/Idh/MocA family protein [Thermodesulfobacteriota bacterium]
MNNIAFIGAGDIVRKSYLPALTSRSDCKIVGICSQQGRSASELASHYRIERVFSGYLEVLESDIVDTVFICTPTHLHREIAEAAMAHNKHVLVEKPLCTSYEDGRLLLRRARTYPKTFYVTFNNQFRAENAWLKERVLNGNFGEIELIDMEWFRRDIVTNKPWLYNKKYSGGGVLIDLGTHLIHLALSLIPDRHSFIVYCNTISHNLPDSDVEDTANAMITINGITNIQLRLAWDMESLEQKSRVDIEVYGRKKNASNHRYDGKKVEPFSRLIDDFFHHIESNKKPDLALIEDTMILIESMYRSQKTNTLIKGKFRALFPITN